jgi:hypothetical protein
MKEYREFKGILAIFFTITGGLCLLFLGAILIVNLHGALIVFNPNQLQYFESIIIMLSLIGIPGGHYLHKKRLEHLHSNMSITERLLTYKTSYFIKLIVLQCIGLITLMGYTMSGNGTFLVIFAILLITLLINYPSESRVFEEIHLDQDDEDSDVDN